MSLSSTVTPATIATAMAQPEPTETVAGQWTMWINDAVMLIDRRAVAEGVDVDQDMLDYVVREAVVVQVKKPDDATQVSIQVDDGMTSKSYKSSKGRVTILDEWWDLLGIGIRSRGAFEVDLFPKTSPYYRATS